MFLEREIILHLSLIDGVGPGFVKYITKDYSFLVTADIYTLSETQLVEQYALTNKRAKLLYEGLQRTEALEQELLLLKKNNIEFITPYDDSYPKNLRSNSSFPPVLYVKATKERININDYLTLSIVSSRQTSHYGKRAIFDLIENIPISIRDRIAIVSGGAIGGDTYIHEATLKNKIMAVSVLGSGLLSLYPKCNERLFENILDTGGVLLSHFPLQMQASPVTFPVRNAIVAGISSALLVVQAGKKSGTLITANYALEYGRTVGAVPGQIDDPLMVEANNLIKQGAVCVTSSYDLLSLLGYSFQEEDFSQKKELYSGCTKLQKNILNVCVHPHSIEELAVILEVSSSELYNEILYLTSKQYLKEDVLGCFLRV